jgi:putative ABC transport system permease protein
MIKNSLFFLQFYYAFTAIKNAGANNLIKIISLSLGLFIGLLLFSKVAFELSYDHCYREVNNMYLVKNRYVIGGQDRGETHIVMAPMAPALDAEFPEVTYATAVFANKGNEPFFYSERKFELKPLFADSLFFKTVGVNVLSGDDRLLGVKDNVFISDRAARLIFGNEDPVGKTLLYMQNYPYRIQGVFEDIPLNNSLRGDIVVSFVNVREQLGLGFSWDGGDSFWGVVRLTDNAKPENINKQIPALWRKHFDYDRLAEQGLEFTSFLSPFKALHADSSSVKSSNLILSALALIILLIATLNYVLISIAALTKRAKTVGIHKCSGASATGIFGMFLWETGILTAISLALTVLLYFVFDSQIASMTDVPLTALFSVSNIWVSGLVVLFLFLMAGVIPARLCAVIPVTRIFSTLTGNRSLWKKILLFIQFLGITFVTLLLIITFKQYHKLISNDLGYNAENLVYIRMNGVRGETGDETKQNIRLLQQELERFSFVESSATSTSIPMGYSGTIISDDNGNILFSSRFERADDNYIPMMGMQFVKGGNFTGGNQVIVTEEFVKRMGWKDNPVGKEVKANAETSYGTIVGVLKDYASEPLLMGNGYAPVLMMGREYLSTYLTLRLTKITDENLKAIDSKLSQLYPNDEMGLTLLKDRIDAQYDEVRKVRNIAMLACGFIFLITLMGLIGYVNDEVQRKKKEIAIRKINGATVADVLGMIARNTVFVALPALLLASVGAYFAGEQLLGMFTVKIKLDAFIFGGGCLAVLSAIVAITVIRSWKAANENPSRTISFE